MRKPRQSSSAAGDQASQLNVQPPSSRWAWARWSRCDACPGRLDLAAIAAEAGYADQAHLTRECGKLSGLTPAALARQRTI